MRSVKLSGVLLAVAVVSYLAYDRLVDAPPPELAGEQTSQAAAGAPGERSKRRGAARYCNGQPRARDGEPLWPNGQTITEGGRYLYPNGQVLFDGRGFWPNGQELRESDTYRYPNGAPTRGGDGLRYPGGGAVVVDGRARYPNGQATEVDGELVYPDGAPARRRGGLERFQLEVDGDRYTGVLDLSTGALRDMRIDTAPLAGWTVSFALDREGAPRELELRVAGDDHELVFTVESLEATRQPLIKVVTCADG